jgi:hypothetical protein
MVDHSPPPLTPPPGNGSWRVLILDRDAEDPKWIFATITLPTDVRPAELDGIGRYSDWEEATDWGACHVPRRGLPGADHGRARMARGRRRAAVSGYERGDAAAQIRQLGAAFPGWECWRGPSGLWYARRHGTRDEPVRGEDATDLADSIVRSVRLAEATRVLGDPYATGRDL